MDRGPAQCEWVRQGGAVRMVPRLLEPEMVILPGGEVVAIVGAAWSLGVVEEAFEQLLGRLWLVRYGTPEAREHLRAWAFGDSAA
jgi:hypothetical protein